MKKMRLKYYLMVVVTTLLIFSISIEYLKDCFDVDLANIEVLDGEQEIDAEILELIFLSCFEADEWSLRSNSSKAILIVSKYERTPPTPPPDFR